MLDIARNNPGFPARGEIESAVMPGEAKRTAPINLFPAAPAAA
jgi:hypothetical protein